MNLFFKLRHRFCLKDGLLALHYGIGNLENDDDVQFVYCVKHKTKALVNKNYSQQQRNMEKWKIRKDGELKWY